MVNTEANMYSFQVKMNVRIVTESSPGPASGITILIISAKGLQPSIFAASVISLETSLKNPMRSHTAKGILNTT